MAGDNKARLSKITGPPRLFWKGFRCLVGRRIRSKNKKEERAPADESNLNMGNTYLSPPEYYYDIEFNCRDCGIHQIWTAQQQKWWYEEAGGYFFSGAIRCRECRKKEQARKKSPVSTQGMKNPPNKRPEQVPQVTRRLGWRYVL